MIILKYSILFIVREYMYVVNTCWLNCECMRGAYLKYLQLIQTSISSKIWYDLFIPASTCLKKIQTQKSTPLNPPNPGRIMRGNILNYIAQKYDQRGGCFCVLPFWHFFLYIRLSRAPRRFLEVIKIATESWECVFSDEKFWSTGVDLLGNIFIAFSIV